MGGPAGIFFLIWFNDKNIIDKNYIRRYHNKKEKSPVRTELKQPYTLVKVYKVCG